MNPSSTCEVAQPPSPPCRSAERTERCGKQKWEPQNKDQLVCSTKTCKIYGAHDTEPIPDYPCPARRIKAKDKNSLGSPVGMVASNVNFKTEGKPADISQARYATYLKAFARLHLNPETMWSPILLDEIMREGLALYTASVKRENKLESPDDIYTASEKPIQREFEMSGCKFQVELMNKFNWKTSGGKGDGDNSDEVPVTDLKPALRSFFRQHKHCLLALGAVYAMIWGSRGVFFVLDVCGRRTMDFYADREKGVAMLVCLKTLENVRHLLLGLTNLHKVDSCTLREIKVVKLVMPSGGVVQRDYGTRTHQYEIINEDYAYLKSSLHLTLNKADLLRNRSALPVGVVAIVVSKIEHPATWNMQIVDKILCFGVSFCQACWIKCMVNDPIDVEEFPSMFQMGQFRVNVELKPRKYEGSWRCVPGYRYSELALAIEKALEAGDQKLLIQINYQMYAVWKKHGFIYLLDPYRHRILGKPGEPEIYEEMEKSATLRMFRSFEVFMNTFNHILSDSNRTSKFYIHTMKIKNIQLREKKHDDVPAAEEEAKVNVDAEVKSLNEHICFEESDDLCQKALAEISDYEDEDLFSDLDELELKTSSSEAEEAVEEEEAGAGGEEEEMQGLESSSSGEDEAALKKGKGGKVGKGGTGKKARKGGKGGKGGKAGKSAKKGKGAEDTDARKKAAENTDEEEATKKGAKNDENKDKNRAKANKSKLEEDEDKKAREEEEEKGKKQGQDGKGVDKSGVSKDGKQIEDQKKPEEIIAKQTLERDTIAADEKKDQDKKQDVAKDKDFNKEKNLDKDKDKTPNKDLDKEKDTNKPLRDNNAEVKDNSREVREAPKLPDKDKDVRLKEPPKICHKDGTEADDENEDDFFKNTKRFCDAPNPNRYPGYFKSPLDMAVVGSENGSYDSLCTLLQAGFRRADRLLALTPWGNFVVFRCMGRRTEELRQHLYYLFDGCTCNVNRFRHLDLSIGTAGLLCFKHMHDIIEYMRRIRKIRSKENRRERLTADEICRQYCR